MTDLQTAMARIAQQEKARNQRNAARSAAPGVGISQARRDLVRTMMLERYSAEIVAERFPKIDWDNMTEADFKTRFAKLKTIPALANRTEIANAKAAQQTEIGRQDLVDGYYTIVFPETEDEPRTHVTLSLRTQKADAEFMPGKIIVSMLVGSDNENDYMRVGHIIGGGIKTWAKHRSNARLNEALLVLCGDPRACQAAYAEESRCCARCGRTLTHPDSQVFGPECAKKMSA